MVARIVYLINKLSDAVLSGPRCDCALKVVSILDEEPDGESRDHEDGQLFTVLNMRRGI
jgi:hypothetical protein